VSKKILVFYKFFFCTEFLYEKKNQINKDTSNNKKYLIETHPTNVMISADGRAWRKRLTSFDHNRVFVIMNSAGGDASRGEFPLLALFRNKHAFSVCFLVLRLLRFLIKLFIFLLHYK